MTYTASVAQIDAYLKKRGWSWDIKDSGYHPRDDQEEVWRSYTRPDLSLPLEVVVAERYQDWPRRSKENIENIALAHSQSFEVTLRDVLGVAERLAELSQARWVSWARGSAEGLSEGGRAVCWDMHLAWAQEVLALIAESDLPRRRSF